MTELKNCPFCGNWVSFSFNIDLEPDGIRCAECKTELRFQRIRVMKKDQPFGEVMEQMAEVWNRRAE